MNTRIVSEKTKSDQIRMLWICGPTVGFTDMIEVFELLYAQHVGGDLLNFLNKHLKPPS